MGTQDAIALLVHDHRRMAALFRQYDTERTADGRADIVHALRDELTVHAAVEEALLYPFVAEEVPGGHRLASQAGEDHERVRQVLARLDELKPGDRRQRGMMRQLAALVERHVDEEEGELLPRLRSSVAPSRLEELGEALATAEAERVAGAAPGGDGGIAAAVVDTASSLVERAIEVARRLRPRP